MRRTNRGSARKGVWGEAFEFGEQAPDTGTAVGASEVDTLERSDDVGGGWLL